MALLLAVAVAYLGDPVLSDQRGGSEAVHTLPALESPVEDSATSTPPTATSTPEVNSPPTVQVMTFSGTAFPDDGVYKVNISGSRVSIRLRG